MSSIEPIRATWKGDYREKRDDDGNVLEHVPTESLEGIPARDLREDEYQALSVEQRAQVRASDLWDTKTDDQMKPAIRRADRAVERAAEAAEKEQPAPTVVTVTAAESRRASAGGID